jgi:metal-responsive CopG/Arc/MetJ family transcriptional regulator
MKTAVSLPDDVFAEAEGVAKKAGISRSELYARAIRSYLAATRDDRITEQLNEFYDSFEQKSDDFLQRAAEIELMRPDSW